MLRIEAVKTRYSISAQETKAVGEMLITNFAAGR